MDFINKPNLPQKSVGLAVVDGRISQETEQSFSELGVSIIKARPYPNLQRVISCHPDVFLNHTGGNVMVYAPRTDPGLLRTLSRHGFVLVRGETELSAAYPGDIAYNAAIAGAFYFHNLKHTDPILRRELEKQGFEPVNIAQGYSKCSISVVDENSMITADKGIAKAAEKKGFQVLLLEAEQNISLPGLDQGFIGGSSGMLGKDAWAVAGSAEKLASYHVIAAFLEKKKIRILSLSGAQVLDVGSILPLKTY